MWTIKLSDMDHMPIYFGRVDYDKIFKDRYTVKITFIKELGRGSFGSVNLYNVANIEYIAVKKIPIKFNAKNEVINHCLLPKHPHIIEFKHVINGIDHTYIFLEYAQNGSLFDYLRQNIVLNEDMCKYFINQLIHAIEHCHKHNIIHSDIKLENVLLDKHYTVKLADFGYSRLIQSNDNRRTGTIQYMAPELIINYHNDDDRKIDIYSCGICMYIMLHGYYPFGGDKPTDLIRNIIKRNFTIADTLTSECVDLLEKMMGFDANNRISIDEIKKHPWMQIPMDCPYTLYNRKERYLY